ncbi:MAG: hypothetical protein RL591_1325 [Planctomycetota bacterium]|jgi:diadenosine tetraphosphate (Ap4A) HIT family hydrolase
MATTTSGTCPFCPAAQRVYLESPRWVLQRHVDPVPIAGWMMVASRAHRSGLDEMTPEEAGEIGTILSALAAAVRAITGCERTYSITFNEAVKHLHLHVIPRHASDPTTTSWALADRYRSTARGEVAAADPKVAETTAEAIARHMMEVGAARSTALAQVGFRLPS